MEVGKPVASICHGQQILSAAGALKVYYSFNPIFMLAEPLMLASVFFFFFMACVAYLHVDLSIRK
ncbi:unnamed protein product [Camellia sinensis]